MNIVSILNIIEFVVSVMLIIVILMQTRGSDMGAIFGGGGGSTFRSKRGTEALLFNATIVLGTIFTVVAMAIAVLNVRSI